MAGRGRKGGPTRMDLRRQNDAAEAREGEEKEVEEEEDEDEDEDEDEEEGEGDGDAEAEADADSGDDDDDGGDDDDEDGPKKKKKKKVVKKVVAKKPTKRKTVKEVRMRAMWVVLDNSSKRVGSFDFKDRKSAEELMAKKLEEKPGFYIQLAKEPLEV